MASGNSHSHVQAASGPGHERSLWIALALTTTFMVAEVIGGLVTGSLALISDAAHMFTDTAALAISLAAIQIGKRAVDAKRTFGYYRFEILAAAFNALLLFGVAIYILYEAWQRMRSPQTVDSIPMLIIAALGLVVNLVSMRLLSSGKDRSLNVKGAYLEVWSGRRDLVYRLDLGRFRDRRRDWILGVAADLAAVARQHEYSSRGCAGRCRCCRDRKSSARIAECGFHSRAARLGYLQRQGELERSSSQR